MPHRGKDAPPTGGGSKQRVGARMPLPRGTGQRKGSGQGCPSHGERVKEKSRGKDAPPTGWTMAGKGFSPYIT